MKHKVRNCTEWDASKFVKYGCVGMKYDGVRGFYYPNESTLISRDEKPLYGFDHIIQDLKDQNTQYPVDMELYAPDIEFNTLSGQVRDHNEQPHIHGFVIDVVSPGTIIDRFKRRPGPTPHIINIPHWKVKSIAQVYEKYNMALASGIEGVVWKSFQHEYTNQRNWHWMRMVPIQSEDCEVLGVYEGKGKMAGLAGGIYINFRGIKCKCGTMKGLSYEDRWELLDNALHYIDNAKAEIHYKGLQPSGKPRQPRFKGWRWDK